MIKIIDKIVRATALSFLIPYSYLALVLAAFATDDPNSGMGGFYLVLAVMSIPFILIIISSLRPLKISRNIFLGSSLSHLTIIASPILFYAFVKNLGHALGNWIYLVLLFIFLFSYFLVHKFYKLN